MKVLKFWFISIIFVWQLRHLALAGDGFLSFKMVLCQVSDKFVYKNFSCFAKSFSRTFSTANAYLAFKKPLNEFYVSD
jgi:hypothetical protein